MMGLCFLYFFNESAVLEFELSGLDDIDGIVSFGDAGEKVLLIMGGWGIFRFGVLNLLDTILESLNLNVVDYFMIRAFLDFFEPHWIKWIKWKKQINVKILIIKSFYRIITWNTQFILKNSLDEEIHMNHSIQSTRDYANTAHKQHRESRQGDWICIKCNNLNFSFRKRCNRCKGQTREENEEHIRQAYQYYQDYYNQLNLQECQSIETPTSMHHEAYASTIHDSPSPSTTSQQGFDESFEEIDLPSVSPIIKRYNKEKSTPKTQISQGLSSDEESVDGMEYLNEYCWQNIMIEDEMESEYWSREGLDQWDVEIERIVQNIVL